MKLYNTVLTYRLFLKLATVVEIRQKLFLEIRKKGSILDVLKKIATKKFQLKKTFFENSRLNL